MDQTGLEDEENPDPSLSTLNGKHISDHPRVPTRAVIS